MMKWPSIRQPLSGLHALRFPIVMCPRQPAFVHEACPDHEHLNPTTGRYRAGTTLALAGVDGTNSTAFHLLMNEHRKDRNFWC